MFFIYILFSPVARRYYVGSTQDVQERLRQHNAGKSLSTRAGIPWQLVHTEAFNSRSQAVRRESQIKARGISRYLESIASFIRS